MQDHNLPGRQKISCNARPDHTSGSRTGQLKWAGERQGASALRGQDCATNGPSTFAIAFILQARSAETALLTSGHSLAKTSSLFADCLLARGRANERSWTRYAT